MLKDNGILDNQFNQLKDLSFEFFKHFRFIQIRKLFQESKVTK